MEVSRTKKFFVIASDTVVSEEKRQQLGIANLAIWLLFITGG